MSTGWSRDWEEWEYNIVWATEVNAREGKIWPSTSAVFKLWGEKKPSVVSTIQYLFVTNQASLVTIIIIIIIVYPIIST